MKIGITGGIGSGKSYVCRLLQQHHGISVYDCDSAAKRLMRSDEQLRLQLTRLIGSDCYTPDGQLNKASVARFLLASQENAQAIDDIVHPAVFRDFEESGYQWIESAILFESGIDRMVDRVVVVTAPEEVRLQRVMQRDGITREKAYEWMTRQLPQDEVRLRADFEIINDGTTPLVPQIEKLIETIQQIKEK
jgi:dephospho-CoA kinase